MFCMSFLDFSFMSFSSLFMIHSHILWSIYQLQVIFHETFMSYSPLSWSTYTSNRSLFILQVTFHSPLSHLKGLLTCLTCQFSLYTQMFYMSLHLLGLFLINKHKITCPTDHFLWSNYVSLASFPDPLPCLGCHFFWSTFILQANFHVHLHVLQLTFFLSSCSI